eukprot:scaffold25852_cov45-Isochrysis_galbana.AAC.1
MYFPPTTEGGADPPQPLGPSEGERRPERLDARHSAGQRTPHVAAPHGAAGEGVGRVRVGGVWSVCGWGECGLGGGGCGVSHGESA